jgi:hypothetical protein
LSLHIRMQRFFSLVFKTVFWFSFVVWSNNWIAISLCLNLTTSVKYKCLQKTQSSSADNLPTEPSKHWMLLWHKTQTLPVEVKMSQTTSTTLMGWQAQGCRHNEFHRNSEVTYSCIPATSLTMPHSLFSCDLLNI